MIKRIKYFFKDMQYMGRVKEFSMWDKFRVAWYGFIHYEEPVNYKLTEAFKKLK